MVLGKMMTASPDGNVVGRSKPSSPPQPTLPRTNKHPFKGEILSPGAKKFAHCGIRTHDPSRGRLLWRPLDHKTRH